MVNNSVCIYLYLFIEEFFMKNILVVELGNVSVLTLGYGLVHFETMRRAKV
jgi:hypothetical protein